MTYHKKGFPEDRNPRGNTFSALASADLVCIGAQGLFRHIPTTDEGIDLIAGKAEERQLFRLIRLWPIRLTQPLLDVVITVVRATITSNQPLAGFASGGFG